MENVLIATHAVLPTLIILIIGYMLKKLKVLNNDSVKGMNTSITNVFLPCLTSSMVLSLNTSEMKDFRLLSFCIIGVLFVFILGTVLIRLLDENKKTATSMLTTILNTNCIILGGSIAMSLYGALPPIVGFATSIAATFMNTLAIITLEFYKNKSVSIASFISVLKKPIIFAVVISIIIKLLDIKLPDIIPETMTTLGKATMPVALISLGVFFDFDGLYDSIGKIVRYIVVHYAISITIIIVAIKMGFTGERLSAILFIFMAPAAVSTYPFSIEYDMDSKTVGNILIVSTIFSIFVFSLCIYLFRSMGL